MPEGCPFHLMVLSEREFILEDVEAPVEFELDGRGNVSRLIVGFSPNKKLYGYPMSSKTSSQE